jgi:hypothetical protein
MGCMGCSACQVSRLPMDFGVVAGFGVVAVEWNARVVPVGRKCWVVPVKAASRLPRGASAKVVVRNARVVWNPVVLAGA